MKHHSEKTQRRYARLTRSLPFAAVALAVAIGLWPLAGVWYTAARQEELSAVSLTVNTANLEELTVPQAERDTYGLLSAARAVDENGHVGGFVVVTVCTGYKSPIRVQSTFSADGRWLAGMRVLSQNETEYLGERVATEAFAAPFKGRKLPVKLSQSAVYGSPVDGIAGATISSKAVVDAVNNAHGFLAAYLTGAA